MKISEIGEFGLIRNIQQNFSRKILSTLIGIGDDAAAVMVSSSKVLLATTDLLLEGVHFDLSYSDFYSLGWKSAAVNLSDIAAMGGIPRFCLTSLGLPSNIKVEQVNEFYRGFGAIAGKHGLGLVGGDTCGSQKGMVISVTILGEVEKSRVLTRSGARPGDSIFTTGTLGDSAAGMEILRSKKSKVKSKKKKARSQESRVMSLIQKHLRPTPRVDEGRKIALSGCASAMIDISDGLSSDLGHICEQSGVGAEVYADKIPISTELKQHSGGLKNTVLHYALAGGEDYELLFTAPEMKLRKLSGLKMQATEIGKIIKGKAVHLVDGSGNMRCLSPLGYDHFRPHR